MTAPTSKDEYRCLIECTGSAETRISLWMTDKKALATKRQTVSQIPIGLMPDFLSNEP